MGQIPATINIVLNIREAFLHLRFIRTYVQSIFGLVRFDVYRNLILRKRIPVTERKDATSV